VAIGNHREMNQPISDSTQVHWAKLAKGNRRFVRITPIRFFMPSPPGNLARGR
jgi:hypothetical protein